MKTLVEILSTVFLTVGAVIGAGFISGRELLSFFGSDNFVVLMPITGLIFFVCFYIIFCSGRKTNGLKDLNSHLFKTPRIFSVAVNISCFLSSAVMLSAVDALTEFINPIGFPVFSILVLILLSLFSKKGVNGAKTVNLIIMPIVIIAVNVMILLNGKLAFPQPNPTSFQGLGKAVLYVTMNVFVNLPSFIDGSIGKDRGKLAVVALISAFLLVCEATLILATISGYGKDLTTYSLPFFFALGGENSWLLTLICLLAVFTSLTTAYYPLYSLSKRKNNKLGGIVLATACFLTSRLGIKNIIDYAYPIIGGFGGVYLIFCLVFLKKKGYGV